MGAIIVSPKQQPVLDFHAVILNDAESRIFGSLRSHIVFDTGLHPDRFDVVAFESFTDDTCDFLARPEDFNRINFLCYVRKRIELSAPKISSVNGFTEIISYS